VTAHYDLGAIRTSPQPHHNLVNHGTRDLCPSWTCCRHCQWTREGKTRCNRYLTPTPFSKVLLLTLSTVEIVSEKSALIDGPKDGASRQVIQLSHLQLLPVVMPKFPRGARSSTVAKKLASSDIEKKFEASRLAKKAAVREKRANLSDFDRFKVQRLKKQVCYFVFVGGFTNLGLERFRGEEGGC